MSSHYETSNESSSLNYRTAVRSLKKYKQSKDYLNDLRDGITRAAIQEAEATTEEGKRKARLRGLEARTELDLLLTGEGADVFRGLVRLPMPSD